MPENTTAPVALPPLLVDAKAAAALLSISRTHFLSLRASGQIGPVAVRLGRRTLWRTGELRKWADLGCPPADQWRAMQEVTHAV